MSGHSKWSTIKHKKANKDARRGKLFSKLIRELTVAAKEGGGDPAGNPRLRLALQNAKGSNMPMETIQRAVKKGVGGNNGENYEEVSYEGYGPAQIAVLVQALTDNRNRTAASVRATFSKCRGSLGAPNSVGYLFERKGWIEVPRKGISEEALMELVLESGADDLESDGEAYLITCEAGMLEAVRSHLEAAGVHMTRTEVIQHAQNKQLLTDKGEAERVIQFLEQLEDNDDVQRVYTNLAFAPDLLENLELG